MISVRKFWYEFFSRIFFINEILQLGGPPNEDPEDEGGSNITPPSIEDDDNFDGDEPDPDDDEPDPDDGKKRFCNFVFSCFMYFPFLEDDNRRPPLPEGIVILFYFLFQFFFFHSS
jgi:hypothetical protein